LQRVIRGIALAGSNRAPSEIGMQAQPAGLERIEVGARGQLVAFRPYVRDIEQGIAKNRPPQLPLETERPALGVRVAKVLLERAVLRIQEAGLARRGGWKLGKPVGITPPRRQRDLVDGDGIWRCGGEVQFDDLRKQLL